MVPPNLNSWSIRRKENVESQQKHANKKNFCEQFRVQRNFKLGNNSKNAQERGMHSC